MTNTPHNQQQPYREAGFSYQINITQKILPELLQCTPDELKDCLQSTPVSSSIIEKVLLSHSTELLHALCENQKLDKSGYIYLSHECIKNKRWDMIEHLLHQKNLPMEVLYIIGETIKNKKLHALVRSFIDAYRSPVQLKMVWEKWKFAEICFHPAITFTLAAEVIDSQKHNHTLWYNLAGSTEVSPFIREILATKKDKYVHELLLQNPRITSSILEKMAQTINEELIFSLLGHHLLTHAAFKNIVIRIAQKTKANQLKYMILSHPFFIEEYVSYFMGVPLEEECCRIILSHLSIPFLQQEFISRIPFEKIKDTLSYERKKRNRY